MGLHCSKGDGGETCINMEYREPGALIEMALNGEVTVRWRTTWPTKESGHVVSVRVAKSDEFLECSGVGWMEVIHSIRRLAGEESAHIDVRTEDYTQSRRRPDTVTVTFPSVALHRSMLLWADCVEGMPDGARNKKVPVLLRKADGDTFDVSVCGRNNAWKYGTHVTLKRIVTYDLKDLIDGSVVLQRPEPPKKRIRRKKTPRRRIPVFTRRRSQSARERSPSPLRVSTKPPRAVTPGLGRRRPRSAEVVSPRERKKVTWQMSDSTIPTRPEPPSVWSFAESPPPSPTKRWERERRKRLLAENAAKKAKEEQLAAKAKEEELAARERELAAKEERLAAKPVRDELDRKREEANQRRQLLALVDARDAKRLSKTPTARLKKHLRRTSSYSGAAKQAAPEQDVPAHGGLFVVGSTEFVRVFVPSGGHASIPVTEGNANVGGVLDAVCKKLAYLGDTSDWGLFEYMGELRRRELVMEVDLYELASGWTAARPRKLVFEPRPRRKKKKKKKRKKRKTPVPPLQLDKVRRSMDD